MNCNCPVCISRGINKEGLEIAEKEVIPFFKTELLKLQYPNHPFPMRYDGLFASVLCFSQALRYNRDHNVKANYFTKNKWMLQFSSELEAKFGMVVLHERELQIAPLLVCEFNTEFTVTTNVLSEVK